MENNDVMQEAKKFLSSNVVASLATISFQENKPEVSVVYYYYDNTKYIYFATTKEGQKINNITVNNNVALTICDVSAKKEIQISGTADFVDDPEADSQYLVAIHQAIKANASDVDEWPLLHLHPEGIRIVRIAIEEFKYSQFKPQALVIEGNSDDLV